MMGIAFYPIEAARGELVRRLGYELKKHTGTGCLIGIREGTKIDGKTRFSRM